MSPPCPVFGTVVRGHGGSRGDSGSGRGGKCGTPPLSPPRDRGGGKEYFGGQSSQRCLESCESELPQEGKSPPAAHGYH